MSYSSRSRIRLSRRTRGTRTRDVGIRGEDTGELRHGLDEFTHRTLILGLGFGDKSGLVIVGLRSDSGVEGEQCGLVQVLELVSILGKNVRLFNRKPMQDSRADRLGETSEIGGVTFPLGETRFTDEVGGIGEEASVVVAEVVSVHISVSPSLVDKIL